MSDSILSVLNLNKTYANGVSALKDISLEIKKSEFIVIIGQSGSGKTTLLKCLNRLVEPNSGDIFFKQKNISSFSKSELRLVRSQLAMIFQQFNLIPRYSVLKNVLMGRLSMMSTWQSLLNLFLIQDKKAAINFLDLVGLADKFNRRADQLSGGQQQRVAIARALMQRPEIILADEPVASLDPQMSQTIMDYLQKINTDFGTTIICNLHSIELAKRYATRIIAIKKGQIIYQGIPSELDTELIERIYEI